jgi:hypothetical protein
MIIDLINDIADFAQKAVTEYREYKIRKDIIRRKLIAPDIKNSDPLMRQIRSATEYLNNGKLYFDNEFQLAINSKTVQVLIMNILIEYKKYPKNFYYNYRFSLLKNKVHNTKYDIILNKYLLLL